MTKRYVDPSFAVAVAVGVCAGWEFGSLAVGVAFTIGILCGLCFLLK